MSGFVTGLVRRGAGLPLPVTMRPANGPQNLPVALEPAKAYPTASPAAALIESVNAQEIGDSPRQAVELGLLANQVRAEEPQFELPAADRRRHDRFTEMQAPKPPAVMTPALQMTDTSSIPEQFEAAPQGASASQAGIRDEIRFLPREKHDDLSPQYVEQGAKAWLFPASPQDQATETLTTDGDSNSAIPAPQRSRKSDAPQRQASPVSSRARVVPRQEAATPAVSVRQATAAAFRKETGARSELRNIQVKIGRVEIRSSQPAAPVRASGKQTSGGFAGLKLARTHLDRSGW